MRIEVLVEGSEPQVYPLNNGELIIGSGSSCDVVLKVEGISRKHLKLTSYSPHYKVTDLGSTNGTFMNEERIVPGRELEFTTFFPLRLGGSVWVSLLTDGEGQNLKEIQARKSKVQEVQTQAEATMTKVIPLNELKQTVKKPLRPKKPASSPEKSKLQAWALGCLVILAAAGYVQYVHLKQTEVLSSAPAPISAAAPVSSQAKTLPQPVRLLVDRSELLSKERLNSLFHDLKCTTELEKTLCQSAQFTGEDLDGVTVSGGSNVIFFISQKKWLEKAKTLFQGEASDDEITKVGFRLFVFQRLGSVDQTLFKDKSLYLAFYQDEVSKVLALTPHGFSQLSGAVDHDVFRNVLSSGYKVFAPSDSFFLYY